MKLDQPRMKHNGYVRVCMAEVNYLHGLDDLCKRYLLKRHKPRVLELGSNNGVSTRLLCEYSNDVTSVDPMLLDGLRELLDECPHLKYEPMVSDEFFKQNKQKFDLIYIDADHSYECCTRDIKNALSHIKSDGIVAGHDFNVSQPGVCKAVHEHFIIHEVFQDSSWVGITCRDA